MRSPVGVALGVGGVVAVDAGGASVGGGAWSSVEARPRAAVGVASDKLKPGVGVTMVTPGAGAGTELARSRSLGISTTTSNGTPSNAMISTARTRFATEHTLP